MNVYRNHGEEIAAARAEAHARAECTATIRAEVGAVIAVTSMKHDRPPIEPLLDTLDLAVEKLAQIDRPTTQELLAALFDRIELDRPGDDDRELSPPRTLSDLAAARLRLERLAAAQAAASLPV